MPSAFLRLGSAAVATPRVQNVLGRSWVAIHTDLSSPRFCLSQNPLVDEEAQRSCATGAFHELIDRVENI